MSKELIDKFFNENSYTFGNKDTPSIISHYEFTALRLGVLLYYET